jgi:hypothetical protein
MAQLAIGVAGGALASSLGLPFGVGFAAASFAAGVLLRQDREAPERPELTDFEIQSSAYGRAIPKVFGTVRLAGSIVAAGPVTRRTREERQGKGSASSASTVTEVEHFRSFAVLLCEGQADLLRVWADKQLVVDLRPSNTGVTDAGIGLTFYRGTESQQPDPRLQEIHGAAKTPAYRGWAYAVFEDFPLTRFGNRIPNLEFEVASNASTSFPSQEFDVPPAPWAAETESITEFAIDPIRRVAFGIGESGDPSDNRYGLAKYDLATGALIAWNPNPMAPFGADLNRQENMRDSGLAIDRDGFVYVAGWPGTVTKDALFKIDPNSLQAVATIADWRLSDYNDIKVGHVAVPGGLLEDESGVERQVAPYGPWVVAVRNGGDDFRIDWGGTGAVAMAAVHEASKGIDWTGDDIFDLIFDPFGRLWAVGGATLRRFDVTHDPLVPTVGFKLIENSTYDLSAQGFNFTRITYDEASHALIIGTGSKSASPEAALIKFDLVSLTVTSTFPAVTWEQWTSNAFDWNAAPWKGWIDGKLALLGQLGKDQVHLIDTVLETEQVLSEADYTTPTGSLPGGFGNGDLAYDALTDCVWLDNTNEPRKPARICTPRKAGNAVTVASIVEAISQDVDLAAADYSFAALTDQVRGFVVESRMPARAAIETLQTGFFFSIVESDWIAKAVKAGAAPSLTVPEDDLGVTTDLDQPVDRLVARRVVERDLPRQVDLSFLDVDQDYQLGNEHAERISGDRAAGDVIGAVRSSQLETVRLPIVLTKGEAATIAERLLYLSWANRTRYSLSLTHAHARIDPADVIAVTKGASTFEMRVTDARLGANLVLQLEAVSEDRGVYSITAAGETETGFTAPSLVVPGPSELILMDIPLLREADDDHGFYLATTARTASTTWSGALVERSLDAVVFEPLISTRAQPAAGYALTALGEQPRWTVWDDDNTVRVSVVNGKTLENKTAQQVLAWANLALIGNELVQFTTATQVEDNVWDLSGLLRGRLGSEDFTGGHVAGDRFVLLSADRIYTVASALSELAATRYYRARSIGQVLTLPDEVNTFANSAVRKKPYAPHLIQGLRDGPGDLTVTWLRRSRLPGRPLNDSPLFEPSEAYEVDVLDSLGSPQTDVLRTITATASTGGSVVTPGSQTAVYTIADQIADFGSPAPATINVVVYQKSATVGRGYGGSATV